MKSANGHKGIIFSYRVKKNFLYKYIFTQAIFSKSHVLMPRDTPILLVEAMKSALYLTGHIFSCYALMRLHFSYMCHTNMHAF